MQARARLPAMISRLIPVFALLCALLAPHGGAAPLYGVICGEGGLRVVLLPAPADEDAPATAHHHCALCAALDGAPGPRAPVIRLTAGDRSTPAPLAQDPAADDPAPRARAPPPVLSA